MTKLKLMRLAKHTVFALLVLTFGATNSTVLAQSVNIEIEDEYKLEGSDSTSTKQEFFFFINITGAIESPIILNWHTDDDKAAAIDRDYVSKQNQTLELMPGDEHLTGENRRKIEVEVINDNELESDETFKVVVSTESTSATITNEGGIAIGHILNEDGTNVSINTFKNEDETIFLRLNFDPPLRYHSASALNNQSTRLLPIYIQKNADITFVDQTDWNSGGKNFLDLDISDYRSYTEDSTQKKILGVEKSELFEFKYDGDQGKIDFKIEKSEFFHPDSSSDILPIVSSSTSCNSRSNCTVTLGVPQITIDVSSSDWKFWWSIVVAFFLAGVSFLVAWRFNSSSRKQMKTVSEENSESISKVVVTSSENATNTLSKEIQASSENITDTLSKEIQASSENITDTLGKEIQASSENITQSLGKEIQSSSTKISSKIDSLSDTLVDSFDKLGDRFEGAVKSISPQNENLNSKDETYEKTEEQQNNEQHSQKMSANSDIEIEEQSKDGYSNKIKSEETDDQLKEFHYDFGYDMIEKKFRENMNNLIESRANMNSSNDNFKVDDHNQLIAA